MHSWLRLRARSVPAALATFPSDTEFQPYLAGTIGAARFNPGGGLDEEARFSATLGAGLNYFFNDRFGLRFEGPKC